jgi:ferritin-like metal-binding protein YciE
MSISTVTLDVEHQSTQAINLDLHELFLEQLAEMYDSEKQLAKALPLIARGARSPDLRGLIRLHLHDTKGHVESLEQIEVSLGQVYPKKKSPAMKGMIREAVIAMVKNRNLRRLDAAIIAAAQKIEHYEIASYGTLCSLAGQMGHEHELALLASILDQEKVADARLAKMGRSSARTPGFVEEASQQQAAEPSFPRNQQYA